MKSVYTKSLPLVLLSACLLGNTFVSAQNTACSTGGPQCLTVTQDFNSGSGGFTGPGFVHNPAADGDMRVIGTTAATAYTLTSPTYALGTPGVAFFGFALSGGFFYVVDGSIRVSIINAAGAELAGCNLPNNIEGACVQLVDPDLTPQPVRYRITITTNSGSNGNGGTISFDEFSNGGAQAALPAELHSFNVRRDNNSVAVRWETASEANVRGFEIQRRMGAGSFQTIGSVGSKAPDGNSSTPLQYSFTDVNNTSGAVLYRIKMIDRDGRFRFSLIRTINGLNEDAKTLIYPNPSTPGPVNIVFPNTDTRDIVVSDLQGRIHFTRKGYKEQDLIINKLLTGSYMVRITNSATSKSEIYRITVTR